MISTCFFSLTSPLIPFCVVSGGLLFSRCLTGILCGLWRWLISLFWADSLIISGIARFGLCSIFLFAAFAALLFIDPETLPQCLLLLR